MLLDGNEKFDSKQKKKNTKGKQQRSCLKTERFSNAQKYRKMNTCITDVQTRSIRSSVKSTSEIDTKDSRTSRKIFDYYQLNGKQFRMRLKTI